MGAVQVRLASDGFLSTPSARRATVALCNRNIGILISIHALREEGDTSAVTGTVIPSDFYPRPPRGGRLSHPSRFLFYRFISIHALREEGDLIVRLSVESSIIFLSTPSARRATTYDVICQCFSQISIHALREEGDLCVGKSGEEAGKISIHALREEGDFWALSTSSPRSVFLSTPSARRATS